MSEQSVREALVVREALGERRFAVDDFPIAVGGPGSVIVMAGRPEGPEAYLGWHEDQLFVQPAEGAQVLHWKRASGDALLAGDILQVTPTRRHVSFMYSYPNYIPLNARSVRSIETALAGFDFADIYGAWWGTNVIGGGREVFGSSVARYLKAIAD